MALGLGYLSAGDLALARKKIERALSIAPESASAHGAMGLYWQERGENKLAQIEFELALDIDDEHSASNYHYGRFLLEKNANAAPVTFYVPLLQMLILMRVQGLMKI